jgi:hypothetical protein
MNLPSHRLSLLLGFSLVLLVILAGCRTLPVNESTQAPVMDVTQAYQTVEARLTLVSARTPEDTPSPAPTDTLLAATPSPAWTNTPLLPSRTPVPTEEEKCNRAAPGFPKIDVEIPDDTLMQPGQRFTKIWRLANSGTCTWTRDYQAVWFFGPKMGEIELVRLSVDVPPKDSVDIVVDMIAPLTPGTYQSNWKLQDEEGTMFGIGPAGNSPFWVRIIVVQPPTDTPSPTVSPPPLPTDTAEPTNTPAPSPTPLVAASGQLTMTLENLLDLDSGNLDGGEAADLAYAHDGLENNWLAPQNGSLLGVFGSNEPARESCLNASMSTAPIAIGSLNPGTYLCYNTSQGLPGWLRMNSVDEVTFDIELTFLSWANSGSP